MIFILVRASHPLNIYLLIDGLRRIAFNIGPTVVNLLQSANILSPLLAGVIVFSSSLSSYGNAGIETRLDAPLKAYCISVHGIVSDTTLLL